MSLSTTGLRNRKPQDAPASPKQQEEEVDKKNMKSTTEVSCIKVLLVALVQGLVIGALGGWVLGKVLWQNVPEELATIVAMQPPRKCPDCPVVTCPTPVCSPYPTLNQCVSRSSETFMKMDPDVDNYNNKRMTYVQDVLTQAECETIIESSGAAAAEAGTVLSFPRSGSWTWLYERVHGTLLQQNQVFWHHRLPANFTSELVEDILLVKYSPETEFAHEKHWTLDIGGRGKNGKRILSALFHLNTGYEGGAFSTMVGDTPFELVTTPRILWMFPSFLLRKKAQVTSGTQYVLHYKVKRY